MKKFRPVTNFLLNTKTGVVLPRGINRDLVKRPHLVPCDQYGEILRDGASAVIAKAIQAPVVADETVVDLRTTPSDGGAEGALIDSLAGGQGAVAAEAEAEVVTFEDSDDDDEGVCDIPPEQDPSTYSEGQKLDLVVAEIGKLDPNDEAHYTKGNAKKGPAPQANALTDRLNFKVSAAMRDQAFGIYKEG